MLCLLLPTITVAVILPSSQPHLILAFWWHHFKSAYPFLTKRKLHQLLLVRLLLCLLLFFFAPDADNFLSKAFVFPCVTSYRWIHFSSSVLSVLSTSPAVIHSFLKKRMFSFIIHTHEVTRVVVLYTTTSITSLHLQLVEGVYKPQ